MNDTPPKGLDPRRPFTPAQMRAEGRSTRILAAKRFTSMMRGVWILTSAIDGLSMIRAALVIHPATAYASFLSAAVVLGLPVPESAFVHVTVTDHKDRRYRPQIKPHVTDRRQNVIVVNGIRTTDPVATFIDCAGLLGLVDLVILGDAILKKYKIAQTDLVRFCERSTDYYAKLAWMAALYVRERVDSPMESRLRMLIVLAGLPEPEVGYRLDNVDGTWRRRLDLYYPGIRLIVEYDGRYHLEADQKDKDIVRREEFDDEGRRIIVVTANGIYREPLETLQRIRRQLIARGMPDVPPLDDRWQEYFGV